MINCKLFSEADPIEGIFKSNQLKMRCCTRMNSFIIKDLVKLFGKGGIPANDHISLTIKQGEIFGILGPNGAGKSTLVRQLAGMIRPTSGHISLFDIDLIKEPHRANQYVALQPQNIWLPAQTKPREILEITGRLRGLSPIEAKRDADEFIEQFGLQQYLDKKMQILSGGLRRLVAIAVTLIGNRPIVILDEPTNDLDPEIRRTVWKRIKDTCKSGRTVILVTHNVVEAEATLDRVCIIRNGQVLAIGSPAELKSLFSQQVRLEIVLRQDGTSNIDDFKSEWPDAVLAGSNHFFLSLPKEGVGQAIAKLLPKLSEFQDFRIVSSNLEDIYFKMSGGDRIAN